MRWRYKKTCLDKGEASHWQRCRACWILAALWTPIFCSYFLREFDKEYSFRCRILGGSLYSSSNSIVNMFNHTFSMYQLLAEIFPYNKNIYPSVNSNSTRTNCLLDSSIFCQFPKHQCYEVASLTYWPHSHWIWSETNTFFGIVSLYTLPIVCTYHEHLRQQLGNSFSSPSVSSSRWLLLSQPWTCLHAF